MKTKTSNILILTCSRVTPSDLSIPTCSPNTASFMVALYLLCRGKRTQQPNSRSPKDTASYWVKRAVYKSWKEARPGGGTFRSKESSLECLEMKEIPFNWSLATFLRAQLRFCISRTGISDIVRPGQESVETPGQFLNRSLQEQVTGTQKHTGQAGQLGDRKDHLQHDKMFWMLVRINIIDWRLCKRYIVIRAKIHNYFHYESVC